MALLLNCFKMTSFPTLSIFATTHIFQSPLLCTTPHTIHTVIHHTVPNHVSQYPILIVGQTHTCEKVDSPVVCTTTKIEEAEGRTPAEYTRRFLAPVLPAQHVGVACGFTSTIKGIINSNISVRCPRRNYQIYLMNRCRSNSVPFDTSVAQIWWVVLSCGDSIKGMLLPRRK